MVGRLGSKQILFGLVNGWGLVLMFCKVLSLGLVLVWSSLGLDWFV